MPSSHIGRVKFYDPAKRFGFIEDFDGNDDAYLGEEGLMTPPLAPGDLLSFEVAPSPRGKSPGAHSVKRLSAEEIQSISEHYHQVRPLPPRLRRLVKRVAQPPTPPVRCVGQVKFFDHDKGFGYVRDLADGSESYVGAADCISRLCDGMVVAFERQPSYRERNDRVVQVRPLQDEPEKAALVASCVPVSAQTWAPPTGAQITALTAHLDAEGWEALKVRVSEAWLPPFGDANVAAILAFDLKRTQATEADPADFRRAVLRVSNDAARSALWLGGWDQAYSLSAAATACASGDPEAALRRVPADQLESLYAHLIAAEPHAEGLRTLLNAALDATRSSKKEWSPADRRTHRATLIGRDRQRVKAATDAVLSASAEDLRLELFLDGYHDDFDLDLALRPDVPLSRPVAEGLLAFPRRSGGDPLKVLLAAQHPGDDESALDRIGWLCGLAAQVLSQDEVPGALRTLTQPLSLPDRVALWESERLPVPPVEALVAHASAVSWDAFERAVRVLDASSSDLVAARLVQSAQAWERLAAIIDRGTALTTSTDEQDQAELDGLGGRQVVSAHVVVTLDEQAEVLADLLRTVDLVASADGLGDRARFVRPLLPLPDDLHLAVWEHGVDVDPPHDAIRRRFENEPDAAIDAAGRWLANGRLDPARLLDAVAASAQALPEADDARAAETLRAHLRLLSEHGRPAPPLRGRNADLARVHAWLQHDDCDGFDPAADRRLVVYLPPADQVRLLRKLAALHERGDLVLTADHLKGFVVYDADLAGLAQEHHGVQLDLSAEVFIQVVVGLLGTTRRLREGSLLHIAYRGLATRPDRTLTLADLDVFERCSGRMTDSFDAPDRASGVIGRRGDRFVLGFPYSAHVVDAVKRLPGRSFDPETKSWTVPVEHENAVRVFALAQGFAFNLTGKYKTDNKHFFQFKRSGVPQGITYCEGREALQPDRFHDRPFWWCTNGKCFQNAETPHDVHQWESYTLLDVARALGCDVDDHDRAGHVIPNGRYYAFVGAVNRVNRLLPHLQCGSCRNPLYPEKTSHFAHYRVTQFWCLEGSCTHHRETVYLHHCLRGACEAIIDSRDTKKCPNGWYVCTSPTCGACCSDRTFTRRAENLAIVGASDGSRGEERGHLEASQAFCSRCGPDDVGTPLRVTEKDARGATAFECPSCGREVDRRWRR